MIVLMWELVMVLVRQVHLNGFSIQEEWERSYIHETNHFVDTLEYISSVHSP
jgi:hypothetical protein